MRRLDPDFSNRARQAQTAPRRGAAALWCLITIPALLLLLVFVSDIGRLWLAKVELGNALEAAALAGVKEWQAGATTAATRTVVQQYALANSAGDLPVNLSDNSGAQANGNAAGAGGEIILGTITGVPGNYTFDATQAPNCGVNLPFAVLTQKTHPVTSLFTNFLGASFGPYAVRGRSIAWFSCAGGSPQLISVTTIISP